MKVNSGRDPILWLKNVARDWNIMLNFKERDYCAVFRLGFMFSLRGISNWI